MDEHIDEEFWIEMADGFLACTNALFEYLRGWVLTKANPQEVARVKAARRGASRDELVGHSRKASLT